MKWLFVLISMEAPVDGRVSEVIHIERVTEKQCAALIDVIHASSAIYPGKIAPICIAPDGKTTFNLSRENQ